MSIPTINWNQDQGYLTKQLISELGKPENLKVFCGKKDASENTSGDTKIKAAKRIAEVILPDFYKINARVMGECVKNKIDSLIGDYHKHAKHFIKTGEGVNGATTMVVYFVGANGPEEATSSKIKNLWDEVNTIWPYFQRMHYLFDAHLNVNPIAITTGIGPTRSHTQWFQPPDSPSHSPHTISNENIDPVLRAISAPSAPSSQLIEAIANLSPPSQQQGHQPLTASRSFGSEITNFMEPPSLASPAPPSTPGPIAIQGAGTRFPKMSDASHQAIEKMKLTTQSSSKKITPIERLVEVSAKNMEFFQKSEHRKQLLHERSQLLEEHRLLMDEFKAGVYDTDTYHKKLAALKDEHPVKCACIASPESE